MVSVVAFTVSAVLAAGAGDMDEAVRREHARLNGTWNLIAVRDKLGPLDVTRVRGQGGREELGLEAVQRHNVREVTFEFKEGELVIRGGRKAIAPFLWFERGRYELDPSKTPKGIALTPLGEAVPEGDRRTFGAIYMLDGELWICDHGGNVDPPTDFSMDVGIAYPKRIFVLRRADEQGGRPAK